MSLETTVQSLVDSTTSLLVAVNNRKSLLDAAQESASASAAAASASATIAAGLTSFKTINGNTITGTGDIVIAGVAAPTFNQVITALGFTPYSAANPLGYITSASAASTYQPAGSYLTGITSSLVTAALGFTPYNATNPSAFITAAALSPYLTSASAATTYQPVGAYLTGITSGQVTTALGFTPYNSTNPSGYITSAALTSYLTTASAATTYQPIGSYLTGINSSQVTTALGFTPANKAGDTFTGNVLVNAGVDSRTLLQVSGVTQAQFQATASAIRLASNNTTPLLLSTNGVDRITLDSVGNITAGSASSSGVFKVQGLNTGDLVVFESSDASATASPDVVLYRNSASPAAADQVGNILFRGKDSAGNDQSYSRILSTILNSTDGAEAGDLRFGVQTASGFLDLMTLASAGLSVTGTVSATSFTGSGAGLTGITSGQVTTALGFTPYSAANPNGYTSNAGDVTLTGTQVLTNKTLTTPSLSSPTINDGTANGVTYLNGSKVITSSSALQFDGANFGLGVTPSAWGAGVKAYEISGGGLNGALYASPSGVVALTNNYYNPGTGGLFVATGKATRYMQWDGQHIWNTTASGTAGAAISFTQAMTLDGSGNLGIGTTSPADAQLTTVVSVDAASGYSGFRVLSNGTPVGRIVGSSGNEFRVEAISTNPLAFYANNAERMRIDASGNLYTANGKIGPNETQQHTMPAVASDTYTLNAAAQTLSNKTLDAPTFHNGYTEEVFAVTGTTPALSPTSGSIQTWTLTANSTPTAGTWTAGQSITLMINDSASSFTVTWTSLPVVWVGGSAPTLAPASGNTVIVLWKVGTTIYGLLTGQVA